MARILHAKQKLTPEEKTYLLHLVRKGIEEHLAGRAFAIEKPPFGMLESTLAVFVTLRKKDELRGQAGSVFPNSPLYDAAVKRGIEAATKDERVSPLKQEEIEDINIMITIISPLDKVVYATSQDILDVLVPNMHGVVLEKDGKCVFCLPYIWEFIPEPEEFLEQLCKKAGLKENAWKEAKISVFYADNYCE